LAWITDPNSTVAVRSSIRLYAPDLATWLMEDNAPRQSLPVTQHIKPTSIPGDDEAPSSFDPQAQAIIQGVVELALRPQGYEVYARPATPHVDATTACPPSGQQNSN